MPKGLYFTDVVFFRRLISEITERISTKLGHIFTYDCYLKLVRSHPGVYPTRAGAKKRFFWDRLRTLTENISATEHDTHNRKKVINLYRNSPTCPPNLVNFGPQTDENG